MNTIQKIQYLTGAIVVIGLVITAPHFMQPSSLSYEPIAQTTSTPIPTPALQPVTLQPRVAVIPTYKLPPADPYVPVVLPTYTPYPVAPAYTPASPSPGVSCHQVFVTSTTHLGDWQTVCD